MTNLQTKSHPFGWLPNWLISNKKRERERERERTIKNGEVTLKINKDRD